MTTTYDFTEIDQRGERMKLIRQRDFDEYFGLLDQLTEKRAEAAQHVIDLAIEHGCVVVRPTNGVCRGHFYFLHPSLYEKGAMQYSAFDRYGAIMHQTIHDSYELELWLPARAFTVTCK